MSTFLKSLVAAVVLGGLGTGSALAANLLSNGGFETGDFSGWTVSGTAPSSGVGGAGDTIPGVYFPSDVAVRSGDHAAWGVVKGYCCASTDYLTLSQTIAVNPGSDYSIGFFLNNNSSTEVGYATGNALNSIQIIVNGVGLLPLDDYLSLFRDTWTGFAANFNSGTASSVDVAFRIIASGTGSVGLSLDDFYVDGSTGTVPEPTSLFLLGVGLAGLAASRRRKQA